MAKCKCGNITPDVEIFLKFDSNVSVEQRNKILKHLSEMDVDLIPELDMKLKVIFGDDLDEIHKN